MVSFEKVIEMDKTLVSLNKKKKREKTQNKITDGKGNIFTDPTERQWNGRDYYEKLCSNKSEKLDENWMKWIN